MVDDPPDEAQSSFPDAASSRRSLCAAKISSLSVSVSAVHGQSVGLLLEHVEPEYGGDAHDADSMRYRRGGASSAVDMTK